MYKSEIMNPDLSKLVYPTPESQEMETRISMDTHAMLKALSKSTKLPMEAILRVLIELGMPSFTPELAKTLREERSRYMSTRWKMPRKRGFLK